MYAILIPMVLRVIAFDSDRIKNNNHGTKLVKPENPCPCFMSIVPVKLAANNDINKTVQLLAISIIMLAIEKTKIINICQAFADNPEGVGIKTQTIAATNTVNKSFCNFISKSLFENNCLKKIFITHLCFYNSRSLVLKRGFEPPTY